MLLTSSSAFACSCGGNWSEERAYTAYDNVAIVRIAEMKIRIEHENITEYSKEFPKGRDVVRETKVIEASGEVVEQLKGKKSSTVKLIGFRRSNTCSQELVFDEVYVVFWTGDVADFNACNRQPLLSTVPQELIQKWRSDL